MDHDLDEIDDLPNDDDEPTRITYEILPTGTQRAKPLLTSTDGHTYVIKPGYTERTIWQCSVKQKTLFCGMTVIEENGIFTPAPREHRCTVLPGNHITDKVRHTI